MWEHRGITGTGDKPDIVGTYSGRLVVLGNARNLWDDLSQLDLKGADLMGMGWGGAFIKGLHHAVCMHSDQFAHISVMRYHGPNRKLPPPIWHGQRNNGPKDLDYIVWNLKPAFGFHGLFSARVGICLGYEEVILCGCPLEPIGNFWEPPDPEFNPNAYHPRDYMDAASYEAWHDDVFKGKVFSMSGISREILGPPSS